MRCENSFYTSPIKELDLPANDNLKLLMDDDGSDVANESTDDEGNAKSSTSPKSRFADGKLMNFIFFSFSKYLFFFLSRIWSTNE